MAVPTVTRRWNPWNELFALQSEVNRLFDSTLGEKGRSALLATDYVPAVDVLRHENEIVVKTDLPGMRKEDLDITVLNNHLFIRGEKKREQGTDGKQDHRVERFYGRFERVIDLPSPVDGDRVTAKFIDGVLEIHAPLRPEAKPRKISVEMA